MKWETIGVLCALLTLMFLVLIPIFRGVYAQLRPRLYVDHAENTFFTDEAPVGTTFNITIKCADFAAPGVFSYQIKLFYDNTMLEATAAGLPSGHWLTPSNPANIFVVDPGTINNTLGFVSFGVTLLGTEDGKTGGGVIATMTFNITASPPAGGSLTSSINMGTGGVDTLLVDPNAVEIPASTYDLVAATFTYAAPPPPWYLKIEPELIAVDALGDEGVVTVSMYNAKAEARIIGVQFKIVLPEILWTQEEWISPGLFGDIYFKAIVERDAEGHLVVIVLILLLPNPEGVPDRFFEGNCPLAHMKFSVISLPENPTKFQLPLEDVIMVDPDLNVVRCRSPEGGAIIAPTRKEDVNFDGKVDIKDMAVFAVAFGSSSEYPRWNPKADVNRDGKVNILDGVLIVKALGWMVP